MEGRRIKSIFDTTSRIWFHCSDLHLPTSSSVVNLVGFGTTLTHKVSYFAALSVEACARTDLDSLRTSGNWIGANSLPEDSLEMSEDRLEGENKAQFLSFIRKMVKWKPEDRYSAQDLIEDPWLRMS